MLLYLPKIIYAVVAFFTLLFLYLYCRPVGLYCLPCCEDNCSSKGNFTYCINKEDRDNKSNSTYCKAVNAVKSTLKALLKAVMVLLNVLKVVLVNILKVIKKIYNIILDIVNIIMNVGSVVFNFVSKININFEAITCRIRIINFDPCKIALGDPLTKIFSVVGALFDKLFTVLSVAVKGFGKVLRPIFGPVITFVMDVIEKVLSPMVELIRAVFDLMRNVVTFFITFFTQDNPFSYIYWKMIWNIQENIPWVPFEMLPLVLALFLSGQFIGGAFGIYKLVNLPMRLAHGTLS